ncbi:hypothetical protein [Phenylobacterium sp.]|uniref:hypothetical protein n=1 Tax=Phenylobacterium sp. TaxID=1871053 RepID=UPI002FE2FBE5
MAIFVATLEGYEPDDPARLTVLAFVAAEDEAGAQAQALAALAERGWTEVASLRAGEVTDEAAVPDDFATAMDSARRWGLGLIIYEPE